MKSKTFKIFGLVGVLLLLAFAPTVYRLIPFASGTANDTSYAKGSLRVDGAVRLPYYATSDSTKVWTFNSNGMAVLRSLSGLNQNIANAGLRWNANYIQHVAGNDLFFDSVGKFTLVGTVGDTIFKVNSPTFNAVNTRVYINNISHNIILSAIDGTQNLNLQQGTSSVIAGSAIFNLVAITGLNYTEVANGPAYFKNDSGLKATSFTHITGNSGLPVIVAHSGAGTGAAITIFGDDIGGTIILTTGTGCVADSTVATIWFSVVYAVQPRCVMLDPNNKLAATLTGNLKPFIQAAAAGDRAFITANSTPLADNTLYKWSYFIKQ